MKKITGVLLLAVFLLGGCNAIKLDKEMPKPGTPGRR